jgi:hypothetical protein
LGKNRAQESRFGILPEFLQYLRRGGENWQPSVQLPRFVDAHADEEYERDTPVRGAETRGVDRRTRRQVYGVADKAGDLDIIIPGDA